MIQKLRKKIVFIITVILWGVLFGILIAVNLSSYRMNQVKVDKILRTLEEGRDKNGDRDVNHIKNRGKDSNYFRAVKAYAAYVDESGAITEVDENHSDEIDMENAVTEILSKKKQEGRSGSYLYRVTEYGEGKFVAFADNSITEQQFREVLITSFVLGVIGMVILFFVAYFLSWWLVRPVKETFEKQKQFISDASHELKTPIAVIGANAEMLRNHPEEEKYYTYMNQEIQKMNQLLGEMLSMASFDAQAREVERKKINISRILEGNCLPFESIAFEQGHSFDLDIQPDIFVEGNEEEIGRVIGILLDNAIKYSCDGGAIKVMLTRHKGKTVLQIMNEGVPIPPEEREKVFERFYRIDKARDRKRGSFGLGLSIAKNIIENNKGKIYVMSDDSSNTFVVEFHETFHFLQSSFKESTL